MCQNEILQILPTKKWTTAEQLKKQLPQISINSTRQNLRRLRKHKLVQYKKTGRTAYLYRRVNK